MSGSKINVVRTVAELRSITAAWRRRGQRIGLVPTMGALHEGHLALVRAARARCDRTVTSIFVNPTQFAPHEDFTRYPRDEARDFAKLASVECDLVWAPDVAEMYPAGFATRVVPGGPATGLESDARPHFFAGVATVCTKLFCQVGADLAVFGEKDYQQLCVIRHVVRDLDLPIEIFGHPTVREPDGLAMSSRNVYLSAEDRALAPMIYRTMLDAAEAIGAGAAPSAAAVRGRQTLAEAGFAVDYFAVRDAETLAPVDTAGDKPLRVLAAATLGKTRLIDNIAAGR